MSATEELLQFVSEDVVKAQLKKDFDELHVCMDQGLCKSSIVLIGSLIECSLYHYIEKSDEIRNDIPNFDKRRIGLNDLLQWARKYQIIDENLFRLSEPIRDYRNLIHPRVQTRLGVELSDRLVQIAYNVLLEIINSVNNHQNETNEMEIEKIVEEVIFEELGRPPTQADYFVYNPILEKYGFQRGKLIIKRSLETLTKRN